MKTSQIGLSYWRTSWHVLMISQHGSGRSNWSLNGSVSFGCYAARFFDVSSGSVSLRYQLVRWYDVSKMSVSLRYQLKRLCDVLSWSVSLRYHLIYCYDIWYVAKTCQIGLSHSCTSYVMLTSQHCFQRPDLYETYMKRRYDVTCRVGKVTSKNDQEKWEIFVINSVLKTNQHWINIFYFKLDLNNVQQRQNSILIFRMDWKTLRNVGTTLWIWPFEKKQTSRATQNNIFELLRKIIWIEYNGFKIFFTLFPILTRICRRVFANPQKLLKRREYTELQKKYLKHLMSIGF